MTARAATLTIPGQLTHMPRLRRWLRGVLSEWAISAEATVALVLAVTETCTNIIRHGYGDTTTGDIEVHLEQHVDAIRVIILDTAPAFISPQPSPPLPDLRGEGGFGLFLIATLMDEVRYERTGERGNRTLLVKYTSASSQESQR